MRHLVLNILVRVAVPVFCLAGCAAGPMNYPRTYSEVITETEDTSLGRNAADWQANHPDVSGFYPLVNGIDALGARLLLMDEAERTIDAQYFLMKSDMAGALFVGKLLEAADRGVRVRFLLDDIFTSVDDRSLRLLDQHPNVEMRLFNPLSRQGSSVLNYLIHFRRANRRMHNKTFCVDNQVSIVGGRNIADEYYDLKAGKAYRDFDVMAVGPVVSEIGATFDRYWNHALSVPMEAFGKKESFEDLEAGRAHVEAELNDAMTSAYARALESQVIRDFIEDRATMIPAPAEVITDDPEKLLNKVSPDQQILATRMAEVARGAQSELIIISPYFIPGKSGVAFHRELAERGVRVIVLTNSLASNNHIPVHAAYARYRHRLLQAGVELYEMRVNASDVPVGKDEKQFDRVTLHAKMIIVDRKQTFVGSLNLDPRSIDINTEMGVLIDSPTLSAAIAEPFVASLPQNTYHVVEDAKGRLRWHAEVDGSDVVEKGEPQTGKWRRFKAFMSRVFPEGQL